MDAGQQPNPSEAPPSAEDLAAEYLQACEDGELLELSAYAARLPVGEPRETFARLVEDAQRAEGLLPSLVKAGTVLRDRYRILREIGAGGMGKVFEAEDLQLERRVAVKVLAALGGATFDPDKLFQKESKVLASLQHPNIVAVHEAGRQGDVQFLVMDLVDGRSLRNVLAELRDDSPPENRRIPRDGTALTRAIDLPVPEGRAKLIDDKSWWRTVARVMVDVVGTLEAAHGGGVIHRDLKPGNIMLRGDGSPVLLDFGLAGSVDAGESIVTRGFVGSVAYVAPEQAVLGEVGMDPRTDVYQLGLVLYEFLTLRRAFPDDSLTAMLERITRGEFARPRSIEPSIPAELEAICLMATELDPGRRYATARALREDLQRYLEGEELPVAARGGAVADVARRGRYFLRRNRIGSLVAAALLLIGLAWWIAPDTIVRQPLLEPYRYDGTTMQPYAASVGDPAHPEDILGVLVHNEEPVTLYAVSVFGQRDPPDWVLPMVPMTLDDGQALEATDWGLPVGVAADGTHVGCTRLDDVVDPNVPYEGLWVFASTTPQPRLANWMDALQRESNLPGASSPGVPLDVARRLFDEASAGTVRGHSPTLTSAERQRLLETLSASALIGDEDWPFEDPQRFDFYFRVEAPGTTP